MQVIVLNHDGKNHFVYKDVDCTVAYSKFYKGTLLTTPTDEPVSSRALMDRFPQVDDVIPSLGQKYGGKEYNQLVLESNPILPFENIEKIGVSFGDNDFWQTWETALEVIGNSILQNGCSSYCSGNITRNHLVKRINASIAGIYYLSQGLIPRESDDRFKPAWYLKINPTDIYINDEIEQFLEQNSYDQNSEFFIVEIDDNQTYIKSY